ncbi:hypothetical protein FEM48_Zijuj12G0017600 [Ziziphus jujuba var. spinosa]|uniref:RNA polymerase subunit H/Rpb5 C-terminal domain-containing protein n=1 Tax=Ziziphus jujuba var. spinosa TaxID=714518 RepID=A0A978UAH3_ZIZJJ|nr:hypothetical protein FEM48_Zijuj12G0017600 [Ziziphus jujuba var. spinosa]
MEAVHMDSDLFMAVMESITLFGLIDWLPILVQVKTRGRDACILRHKKLLPRMSRKDAIARYYGLERGQVVKVTYSSEITKSHITYRCVW